MKWMAMPAKLAVRFGCQECGIDLQVLLHGEELHPKHLLFCVKLQGQWGVAEHVAGAQRNVVSADGQQQNVVDRWQGCFLGAEEGDPDSQGVRHQRVGELKLQHAALERALGQADHALLDPCVGAPSPHARLADLLHIWRSCGMKKRALMFDMGATQSVLDQKKFIIDDHSWANITDPNSFCDKDTFLVKKKISAACYKIQILLFKPITKSGKYLDKILNRTRQLFKHLRWHQGRLVCHLQGWGVQLLIGALCRLLIDSLITTSNSYPPALFGVRTANSHYPKWRTPTFIKRF